MDNLAGLTLALAIYLVSTSCRPLKEVDASLEAVIDNPKMDFQTQYPESNCIIFQWKSLDPNWDTSKYRGQFYQLRIGLILKSLGRPSLEPIETLKYVVPFDQKLRPIALDIPTILIDGVTLNEAIKRLIQKIPNFEMTSKTHEEIIVRVNLSVETNGFREFFDEKILPLKEIEIIEDTRENLTPYRTPSYTFEMYWVKGPGRCRYPKHPDHSEISSISNNDLSIIPGFSIIETRIIHEARSILRSSAIVDIKRAHALGKTTSIWVHRRLIQYVPGLPASGMTNFSERSFYIGREAFHTKKELGMTILHELYRLATSRSRQGFSQELVAQETKDAAAFAQRAYSELKE